MASKFDYEALVAHQAAHARPGSVTRQIPGPEKVYSLGGGVPDPVCFPLEALEEATAKMLATEGRDLVLYPGPLGYDGLRQMVVEKLQYFEGLTISKDNVMLTSGSMQGIQLLAETFLDPGDVVLIEELSYMGTLRVLHRWKARLIGIPVDDQGLRPDALETAVKDLAREGTRAKFLYTIVNFQNPTGVTLTLPRRQEVLRLAKEHGFFVVEDDSYGDLRCEGEPVTSIYALDTDDIVVRVGTLSKIIGAGVRQGFLIAPTEVLTRLQGLKIDGGTNALASRILAYYLKAHLRDRIPEVQQVYRVKRDAMLSALEEYLGPSAEWTHPQGGMFLWLKLPEGTDPDKLLEAAVAERVVYVPGWHFTTDGQGARNYIRLCYGYPPPEDIREAVRRLARAIEAAGGRLARPVPATA